MEKAAVLKGREVESRLFEGCEGCGTWPKTTTLVELSHLSPGIAAFQAALSRLNLLTTMQLKKLPFGARQWHSACTLSGRTSPEMWR